MGKGALSKMYDQAMLLARLNRCLEKQLPMFMGGNVQLVNINAQGRAVITVQGGSWATQARMQERLLKGLLSDCSQLNITQVVIKNRPGEPDEIEQALPVPTKRRLSHLAGCLLEDLVNTVRDEKLRVSLKRLAHKHV